MAMSLTFSLTVVAIMAKNNVGSGLWLGLAAFAAPLPVLLHFERGIVGSTTAAAIILLLLGAAVMFGI